MDLTNAYRAILFLYEESLAAYAVIIGVCIFLDVYMICNWTKEKDKKFLDLAGVIIFLIITTVVAGDLIYKLRDIPNIQNQNYIIAQGVVVGHDTTDLDEPENRGIRLARYDTGEMVDLHISYGHIPKGMRLEVMYLPYSKIGAVLRELPENPPNK